jgi:hypothetical protein
MNLVQRTAKNPIAWFFYRACGWLGQYLGRINGQAQFVRLSADREKLNARITAELFPDLTVVNGPFSQGQFAV